MRHSAVDMPGNARLPQQARGKRRVDAILDAAAALISEVGIAGVTVQAIAERAGASKGSMYHFFADRESVLRALAERHVRAMRELATEIRSNGGVDWGSLRVERVVDAFLDPLHAYLDQHPDLQLLVRTPVAQEFLAPRHAELNAIVTELASAILCARIPALDPAQREVSATMIVAVLSAIANVGRRAGRIPLPRLRREAKKMLASYLVALEAPISQHS